jgi:hypothetical protein
MWHSQIQSHSRFRCDAKSPRYRKDICLLYILPSLTPACARAFTLLSLLCAALQVLHMHMTDDQSWPLVLSSFPELAARGAFSPNHTYTLSQLDGLIEVSVCLYFLLLLSFVFDFCIPSLLSFILNSNEHFCTVSAFVVVYSTLCRRCAMPSPLNISTVSCSFGHPDGSACGVYRPWSRDTDMVIQPQCRCFSNTTRCSAAQFVHRSKSHTDAHMSSSTPSV